MKIHRFFDVLRDPRGGEPNQPGRAVGPKVKNCMPFFRKRVKNLRFLRGGAGMREAIIYINLKPGWQTTLV